MVFVVCKGGFVSNTKLVQIKKLVQVHEDVHKRVSEE